LSMSMNFNKIQRYSSY